MGFLAVALARVKRWFHAEGDSRARGQGAAVLGLCVALAACSGGTAGDGDSGGQRPGVLSVTVSDTFGAPVAGASVTVTLGGVTSAPAATSSNGVALLTLSGPSGTAEIAVARESFVDEVVSTPVTSDAFNEVAVTLERETAPAGGFLATRGDEPASVDAGRTRLSFELELIVVGRGSQPVDGLTVAAFALQACAPDPAVDGQECLRSSAGDLGYAPVTAAPESLEVIPGEVERAYAATLLMDQSGSIVQSDPTGARLFAAKALLSTLGPDDQALLAAFAAPPGALIPTPPLATYPPFRGQADATGYFADLDSLGPLVGGNTPLYASVDEIVALMVSDPLLPAGKAKAIVVFTDGQDNTCADEAACLAARDATVAEALANQVRVFTIGLSDEVDVESLGELAQGTGGAMLFAETAEQLLPLYGTVGRLLSLSLPTYRVRWSIDAAAPGSFPSGSLLKGRVRVEADGNSFDVPFVVGVP